LAWHHHPQIVEKGQNARKPMKLLPEIDHPVKIMIPRLKLRCNRFSICPCSVSRRHAIIRLSFCRVKNIELLFNIMEAEPFGHDEHSGQ
jgi:hypothetical protein